MILRPECESGGQRGALVRLVLVVAAALAWPHLTQAAAAPQAVVPPAAALAGNHGPPSAERKLAGDVSGTYGPEQRAQELYLDAMEKLEAGRATWAQRTFEMLISRYPDSTAAGLARRQLGALHRQGAAQSAATGGAPAAATITPVTPARARVAASPTWEQELRRNAPIQGRLRNEAGDRVFFGAGSAELGGRAREALAAQAQWLNRWHEFEAAIEGHADDPGSDEENLKLSQQRAEAVRRRLVEEGVEASRLAIVAQGRAERLAICADVDCAAQNRRAVTLVFVSGTRERLGLAAAPDAEALDRPLARAPATGSSADMPAAAERVGVAR